VSVVNVEKLQKTFVKPFTRRRVHALRGVSFEVEAGEVFGFLGPNGAGKTTTMKVLMGLIHPTGGKASVLGAPIGDVAAKRRIGYLPENPYFYDYLTATELLAMVGHLYGLDRATRARRSGELLERVNLTHAARRPLRSYSKGMLQRAGLAQALMGDPDLVVLDEPMSGLDPIGRKEVRDLITELRERGKTVFFCTHILADAVALCDRVGIIVEGKVRDIGLLSELLSPQLLGIDVLWRGPESLRETLRGAFADEGDEHRATAQGELFSTRTQGAADRFVAAVVGGQGSVLQVTPHRETLESRFVADAEAVREARATRAEGEHGDG